MGKKLKSPSLNKGNTILAPNSDLVSIENYQHPIFCFRYLHKDFSLSTCSSDNKLNLLEKLIQLSKFSWNELQLMPKHGMGSEKINRNSLIPSIPIEITEDVDFFLAFRFEGKKPFIGYRNKFVFHIIYIDVNFKVYNHG